MRLSFSHELCLEYARDRLPVSVKLTCFPAGTELTASSRLRAYPLGKMCGHVQDVSSRPAINVFWIQKKLDAELLALARQAKEDGQLIVYDCDDTGPALRFWADSCSVLEAMHLADIVVTDTPERGGWARMTLTRATIRVIENQADYGLADSAGAGQGGTARCSPTRVLWFGNTRNLVSLRGYEHIFAMAEGFQFVTCGADGHDIDAIFPGVAVERHAWTLDDFPAILRSCDISLMSHFGGREHRMKSGHKMITSIYHGVPVVASRTPDYQRIARLVGQTDVLFNSPSSLMRAMLRLKGQGARAEYLAKAQPIIWAKYGDGAFAAAAQQVLGQYIARNINRWPMPRKRGLGLPVAFRNGAYRFYNELIWRRLA